MICTILKWMALCMEEELLCGAEVSPAMLGSFQDGGTFQQILGSKITLVLS